MVFTKQKLILLLSTLVSISCSTYTVKKGALIGFRKKVDKSMVIGYGIGIGKIIPPQKGSSMLKIQTVKIKIHPKVKINQYERLVYFDHASEYGIKWYLYGSLIGLAVGFAKYPGENDPNSDPKKFLESLKWGIGSYFLGAIIGKFKVESRKGKSPIEEKTDIQIGKCNGMSVGIAPNQSVVLTIPSLGQTLEAISNQDGFAVFDLRHKVLIGEWNEENSQLKVLIRVKDTTVTAKINPHFFLESYLKITKFKDNIRSGPGINYPIIAHCYRNEKFRILKRIGNWYEIQLGKKRAWVHKSNGKIVLGSLYQFNPEKPPKLIATASFKEPSGNNMIDANEEAQILVKISNEGKGPSYNLRIKLNSLKVDQHIKFIKEKTIAYLPAGKSLVVKFQLKANYKVKNGKNKIKISFKDQFGFPPDPIFLVFFSHKEEPPNLYVKRIIIDDDSYGKSFGDNDKQIELGETIEVTVSIGNKGTGTAKNVQVEIPETKYPYIFYGDKTKFDLGAIAPKNSKDFSFIFSTNKLYSGPDLLPIKINIFEKRKRFNHLNIELGLRINKYMPNNQFLTFTPKHTVINKTVDIENVPQTGIKNKNGIAVIIGNMHYQKSGIPDVQFAARDAALVRQYMLYFYGFPNENIIYLQDATKADFDQIFGTEKNYKGKLYNYVIPNKSKVFIYYTGHGAPDLTNHEGYFVPVDCDPTYVKLTGYPLKQFYNNLSHIKAKKMVIVIDACFSGQSNAGFILNNISPIFIKVKNPIVMIPNLILFTSSAADQVSHWYPQKEHSLFTYLFLKKINQSFVQDKKSIKAGELFSYLKIEVNRLSKRIFGRSQEPTFWGDPNEVLLK